MLNLSIFENFRKRLKKLTKVNSSSIQFLCNKKLEKKTTVPVKWQRNMETIIVIFLIVIFIIISFFSKFELKKLERKREKHLKTLPKFEISLESIKIDGSHWSENNPVDIYDNELDPNDPFLYRTSTYGSFNNRYHKDKATTKFKSQLYISIPFLNSEHKSHLSLPIEHTIIRMKFYVQKNMTVYIDEGEENKIRFLLDFRFLDTENVSIISTPFFESD